MALITFDNLSLAYGGYDVFSKLTGRIDENNRIGLVGPNGVGKTSLLEVLAGQQDDSGGILSITPDLRIGYLHQHATFTDKRNTLQQEMLAVFERVFAHEAQMRLLEEKMASGKASEADYDAYGLLQEQVELGGLYDYERRIERTLDGLGFNMADRDKSVRILSGGQKTRAMLAKLLLAQPDLLVLDEPTNHLDEEAVRWLESTLSVWKGALLIVSHDRYFLNRVVNRIWELHPEHLENYKGDYDAYLAQRSHRREQVQSEWDTMMERFWKEFDLIRQRTLADPNAKGRFKRLTREVEAVESNGLDALRYVQKNGWMQYTQNYPRSNPSQTVAELEDSLKNLQSPIKHNKNMRLKLNAEETSGELVLRGRNLTIGFERNDPLFTADDIDLLRGEAAALIGPNGAGKSTFLRTLRKEVKPLKGYLTFGESVQVGYFAQAHDNLDDDNTVLDELLSHQRGLGIAAGRRHLGSYLFSGDDVFKQVGDLSGGERARLALAILALKGANLLLLDEPTNHLDVPAQEVLQTVLENFDGTIILVSHDRYLVNRLATQIWDLQAGQLRVFDMDYQAYRAQVEAEQAAETPQDDLDQPTASTPTVDPAQIQRLATQITSLRAEIAELETLLQYASNANNTSTLETLSKQYQARQQRLSELLLERDELTALSTS